MTDYRTVDPRGYLKEIHLKDGSTGRIWTKFPWGDYPAAFRDDFVRYAKEAYVAETARGRKIALVAFDHVRTNAGTYEPRVDFEDVPR